MIIIPRRPPLIKEPVTKVEITNLEAYLEAKRWEKRLNAIMVTSVAILFGALVIALIFAH